MAQSLPLKSYLAPEQVVSLGESRYWTATNTLYLSSVVLFASGATFFIDLNVQLGACVPVLYTGVVWISSLHPNRRPLILCGILCSILTFMGLVWSPVGYVSDWIVLLNRGLSIFAIWLTVVFLSQRKAAQRATELLSNFAVRTVTGALACDEKGNIKWFNEGFTRMLRLQRGVRTQNIFDCVDWSGQDVKRQSFQSALLKGKKISLEVAVDPLSNVSKWVRVDSEPIRDPFGNDDGAFVIISDITQTKRHERILQDYLAYANSIVQRMTKALCVVDQELRIDVANIALQELFVREGAETLKGFVLLDLFEDEETQALFLDHFREVERGNESTVHYEMIHHGKDLLVGIALLDSRAIDEARFTVSFIDVTDYKDALRSVESANDELKQFAYVASHDLQEPLRKISSFLQILEADHREALNDEAKECIDFAVDGANRLQNLITDLLSFTGLTRSDPSSFEQVNCNEAVASVITGLEESLREKGAEVSVGDLPTVKGQRFQIEQLFQNLISNGVKYSEPGVVPKVKVRAIRSGRLWKFEVRDNGIGIEPQYYDRIFKIFQRLHTREEYPGTGIGLAICKRIVQAHGGKIWVRPSPEGGSSFYFTLRSF